MRLWTVRPYGRKCGADGEKDIFSDWERLRRNDPEGCAEKRDGVVGQGDQQGKIP